MKFTVLLVASGAVHADSKYIDLDCTPADSDFLSWTFTDDYKNGLQAWKNQGKDSKVFEELQEMIYKNTLGIKLQGLEVDKGVDNVKGMETENGYFLLGERIEWTASEVKIHTFMTAYRILFTVNRRTGKYTAFKSSVFLSTSMQNMVSARGECDVNVFSKAENAF